LSSQERIFCLAARNLLLFIIFSVSFTTASLAGDFGVNLYGLSYHFKRTTSDGKSFREFNPGLGLKYVFLQDRTGIASIEAGVFSDSERNTAQYVGVGCSLKLVDSLLSIGLTVGPYKSPTLNYGKLLLAIIPTLSTRHKGFSVHLVFAPAYKDVNQIPTLGLYATVYPLEF